VEETFLDQLVYDANRDPAVLVDLVRKGTGCRLFQYQPMVSEIVHREF
jgi:hypothetical protein